MSTLLKSRETPHRQGAAFRKPPWRTIGLFGFMLTVIGVGQLVLYVFPAMGFGSPEWEFGASAQLLGALPFATMGLIALFVAAGGSGNKTGLIALAVFLILFAVAVFFVLGLFWSVVPMALQATPAAMREPINQTIARTTLSGVGFGVMYIWAAVIAVRQVKRSSEMRYGDA